MELRRLGLAICVMHKLKTCLGTLSDFQVMHPRGVYVPCMCQRARIVIFEMVNGRHCTWHLARFMARAHTQL